MEYRNTGYNAESKTSALVETELNVSVHLPIETKTGSSEEEGKRESNPSQDHSGNNVAGVDHHITMDQDQTRYFSPGETKQDSKSPTRKEKPKTEQKDAQDTATSTSQSQKNYENYYNCGKKGLSAKDCRQLKKQSPSTLKEARERFYFEVTIEKQPATFLVDNGTNLSIMDKKYWPDDS
ncbi:hypothetical protein QYM36_012009 [Artemia franciscana]|uniref:Uncharacterized protein n=1 Tax=Artemia franciscana TaxID=6661 RepID=A0AA88HTA5_ARTSF|nr:hypothetical protein QYM36_012009 [Artemia franciscana]